VIAIIIMLFGIVAITRLPISRYPNIAPPSVAINASYPGASAQTVEDSVTQIIEQNMTGLDGLIYMVSTSDNNGNVQIELTFASGTNPDIAQVQAQNRLQQAVPLLPQIVQQQGISVIKSNIAFLAAVGFVSEDGKMDAGDIGDWIATNVLDAMSRVDGVGNAQLFGGKYAMRIWLDPGKLDTYQLTANDVITAIKAQNAQISVGQLGDLPAVPGQQLNAPSPRSAACTRPTSSATSSCAATPTARRCIYAMSRGWSSGRPPTAFQSSTTVRSPRALASRWRPAPMR